MRDLVLRYRGSALGFLWTVLNPLLFMAIYLLVFSVYLRIGMDHYAVFLISGLIPWQWFATSVQLGTSAIVDGRMFVGKTVFPSVVLVLVPMLSNFVNFLLSLPILLTIVLVLHVQIGWAIVALPIFMVIQCIFTLGIMLIVSTMNVFFRDLQQLTAIALTLLFYLIPVIYPLSSVPQSFRLLVLLNPLTVLMLCYQDIFYYNTLPSISQVLYLCGFSVTLFFIGRGIFERYQDAFPDFA